MKARAVRLSVFVVFTLIAIPFLLGVETKAVSGKTVTVGGGTNGATMITIDKGAADGLAVSFAGETTGETKPTPAANIRLSLKNATALYTEYLKIDLIAAARKALAKTGYPVKEEMNIKAFRFESFIHYNPRDRAAAESVRSVLRVGSLREDKTLDPGLIKVILGADAIGVLLTDATFPSGTIILDATGNEGTAQPLKESLGSDAPVLNVFSVNKGMMEKTTVLYPTGGGHEAEEIRELLGMGLTKEVAGLPHFFVVIAPDFIGEIWKDIPQWTPDPAEKYFIVIYKTKAIMDVRNSRGSVVVRYPISIGANPDLADKVAVGDRRTPEGNFTISAISESSGWKFEGELAYGPWFLALNTPPWTGYAIHGTNESYLIGAPASHGCIRLNVENINQLKKAVRVGTPVKIVH